jgi:hypothetical protein
VFQRREMKSQAMIIILGFITFEKIPFEKPTE